MFKDSHAARLVEDNMILCVGSPCYEEDRRGETAKPTKRRVATRPTLTRNVHFVPKASGASTQIFIGETG